MALKSSAVNSGLYSNDQPLSLFKASGSVILSSFDFITSSTFSAVSSVSIDNCFSADYDHYLIKTDISSSANSDDFLLRLRASGSNDSGLNYRRQRIDCNGTTVNSSRSIGTEPQFYLGLASGTGGDNQKNFQHMVISNPFQTVRTTAFGIFGWFIDTQGIMRFTQNAFEHDLTNSYDGISIVASTGNITGSAQIYGWKI